MNRDDFHHLLRTRSKSSPGDPQKDWKQLANNAKVRLLFKMLVDNLQDHLRAASELKVDHPSARFAAAPSPASGLNPPPLWVRAICHFPYPDACL